jgi:DNA-binding NtrC family response regulator
MRHGYTGSHPIGPDETRNNRAWIHRLPRVVFADRALDRLKSYSWPGNIRELENCVKYLTCLQLARPVDPSDLPLLRESETDDGLPMEALAQSGPFNALKRRPVSEFERTYLESALRCSGGNIAAARASGKPRRAFFELMRKRESSQIKISGKGGVSAQHQSAPASTPIGHPAADTQRADAAL